MPAKPAPPPTDAHFLDALREAGEEGLGKVALVGKPARRGYGPALTALVKAGSVINVGDAKAPRFVLPEHDPRPARVRAELEARATPGAATAFSLADLRRGFKGALAKLVEPAVAWLVAERRMLRAARGRTVFYLHAASVRPLLAEDGAAGATKPEGEASPEAIRAAYAALARETGFAGVGLGALLARAGGTLGALHAFLREESRAGRAVPSRGDWSLAGEADRAAALELRGEKYLLVRLG